MDVTEETNLPAFAKWIAWFYCNNIEKGHWPTMKVVDFEASNILKQAVALVLATWDSHLV